MLKQTGFLPLSAFLFCVLFAFPLLPEVFPPALSFLPNALLIRALAFLPLLTIAILFFPLPSLFFPACALLLFANPDLLLPRQFQVALPGILLAFQFELPLALFFLPPLARFFFQSSRFGPATFLFFRPFSRQLLASARLFCLPFALQLLTLAKLFLPLAVEFTLAFQLALALLFAQTAQFFIPLSLFFHLAKLGFDLLLQLNEAALPRITCEGLFRFLPSS